LAVAAPPLVEPAALNPDEIAALCGPLWLVADGAERERRGDSLKGGGRDGDADHVDNASARGPARLGHAVTWR